MLPTEKSSFSFIYYKFSLSMDILPYKYCFPLQRNMKSKRLPFDQSQLLDWRPFPRLPLFTWQELYACQETKNVSHESYQV